MPICPLPTPPQKKIIHTVDSSAMWELGTMVSCTIKNPHVTFNSPQISVVSRYHEGLVPGHPMDTEVHG